MIKAIVESAKYAIFILAIPFMALSCFTQIMEHDKTMEDGR
jgi:hypothetical protein